jgi:hypothetical protein
MKRERLRSCIGLSIVALLLAVPTGSAQPAATQGGAGRGARAAANSSIFTPVELERWFDSYVLVQAQDALKLSDAQFARVLGPLKALQVARRRHAQARRQLLAAVAGLLKATPVDEAALRERLKGLRDLDTRARDELQRTYDALDEVLDATQQARFRLLEEQVERRKIDLLMRARQRAVEQRGR